jgi:hypothetical protein
VHGLMYGPLFETYQSPTDSPDEAKFQCCTSAGS